MIRRNPRGDWPTIAETAFIDPTAIICGLVIIEEDVFVGPYAVIRADETDENGGLQPIRIGGATNIQDGVVIHSRSGEAVTIGRRTSIAHRSIIHGPCTIGDDVLCWLQLGRVQLHDWRRLGDTSQFSEGCYLPAGFHVPSTTTVHSDSDLANIPQVTIDMTTFSEHVARTNVGHAHDYRKLRNDF
ncbi:hypothetical protein [Bradyrhizobium cenepequi]|uniref:hypothetical protein n=1 Tax=Bradyrhizobium cenepequi TaxID=2821403 RepID=UPI001CE27DC8|nr:hypothetical protein [Bradyrhizobium cenepequi]MCA6111260.1 hypothetical protein [Bradyrhizobium cenepequi]